MDGTTDMFGDMCALALRANAPKRHLSPFRYPGGKSWLADEVVARAEATSSKVFVEPFCGGGSVSLAVAAAGVPVVMSEIDAGVAAVWRTALSDEVDVLCELIRDFVMGREAAIGSLAATDGSLAETAFRAILANRVKRGGIMSASAGLMKDGENGNGLLSRWYPDTLCRRLQGIHAMRKRITFLQADAFDVIAAHAGDPEAFLFIDPPYSAGGKNAGKSLYAHWQVDHARLFGAAAGCRGHVVMTYDDNPSVRALAASCGFGIETVGMLTAHGTRATEVVLTKPAAAEWLGAPAAGIGMAA